MAIKAQFSAVIPVGENAIVVNVNTVFSVSLPEGTEDYKVQVHRDFRDAIKVGEGGEIRFSGVVFAQVEIDAEFETVTIRPVQQAWVQTQAIMFAQKFQKPAIQKQAVEMLKKFTDLIPDGSESAKVIEAASEIDFERIGRYFQPFLKVSNSADWQKASDEIKSAYTQVVADSENFFAALTSKA